MNKILRHDLLRLSRIKQVHQRACIVLTLMAWIAAGGVSGGRPAIAQSGCAAAYCISLPIVARSLPIQIVSTSESPNAGKGGTYILSGVIAVTTSQPVYDVTVDARFYDDTDQLIRTVVITPTLAASLPGQHNRFSYSTSNANFRPARYDVTIRTWTMTSTRDYRPVTIVSAQRSGSWELGSISGIIRNDQPRALNDIVVIAEWADAGSSYGIAQIAHLAPGATASFSVGFYFPGPPNNTIPPVVQGVGYLTP